MERHDRENPTPSVTSYSPNLQTLPLPPSLTCCNRTPRNGSGPFSPRLIYGIFSTGSGGMGGGGGSDFDCSWSGWLAPVNASFARLASNAAAPRCRDSFIPSGLRAALMSDAFFAIVFGLNRQPIICSRTSTKSSLVVPLSHSERRVSRAVSDHMDVWRYWKWPGATCWRLAHHPRWCFGLPQAHNGTSTSHA